MMQWDAASEWRVEDVDVELGRRSLRRLNDGMMAESVPRPPPRGIRRAREREARAARAPVAAQKDPAMPPRALPATNAARAPVAAPKAHAMPPRAPHALPATNAARAPVAAPKAPAMPPRAPHALPALGLRVERLVPILRLNDHEYIDAATV